jgi:hypothetical protein
MGRRRWQAAPCLARHPGSTTRVTLMWHTPSTDGHPTADTAARARRRRRRWHPAQGLRCPHAPGTTGDVPDPRDGDSPAFPQPQPTTDRRRAEPNARPQPRQQPQRGTSGGCWRRLQALVRPRCAPDSRPASSRLTPGRLLRDTPGHLHGPTPGARGRRACAGVRRSAQCLRPSARARRGAIPAPTCCEHTPLPARLRDSSRARRTRHQRRT